MRKVLRKLYNIKGMRKQGLSYTERGMRIHEMKSGEYEKPTIQPSNSPAPVSKPEPVSKSVSVSVNVWQIFWTSVKRWFEIFWIKLNRNFQRG